MNLGNSLEKAGQLQTSHAHQLAAAVYFLMIGHRQHLETWIGSLFSRDRINRMMVWHLLLLTIL
jgi:hypothetical protein